MGPLAKNLPLLAPVSGGASSWLGGNGVGPHYCGSLPTCLL